MSDEDTAAELRSFGRRRGRKPSPRQRHLAESLLPQLSLDLTAAPPRPLGLLFSPQAGAPREVWLEIGFGGGEHLVWQAAHNGAVGIIGCEPFLDGVMKLLSAVDEHKLANVRVHADDARPLLRWLPDASISRAFILFPDPWPKKRHLKRRLVSRPTLDLLARVMAPGAELRIATDIADYARTILLAAANHPAFRWCAEGPRDWRERGLDWPGTRYEAKAVREGRRRYYFRFRRT